LSIAVNFGDSATIAIGIDNAQGDGSVAGEQFAEATPCGYLEERGGGLSLGLSEMSTILGSSELLVIQQSSEMSAL
jgi:hypothetical protein